MAIYNDYYTINLSVNKSVIDITPTEYSFSISDSIYSLYNYASFELNDVTGLMQEFFATTEGTHVKIGYGLKEKYNTCKFVVKKDDLNAIDVSGFLSGQVDIQLVHDWYGKQEIKSKAYQATIASIITNLVRGKFTLLDIENTGNNDLWYQMMLTDAKFIQEILLPAAFSPASNSPFYAYTTSDNTFHLKSLNTMLNSSPVDTINYSIPNAASSNINDTVSIRRLHQSSDEHRHLLKRKLYQISRTDGSLLSEDDGIGDYPQKGAKTIPITGYSNEVTGYLNMGFKETSIGEVENDSGGRVNSMKKAALIDRFVILTPLNPKLLSGKTIQLNIYLSTDDGTKLSKHYSGKYIIENSEHIWNSKQNSGYTKIIIGRKYISGLPNSYLLKPALI